MRELTGAVRDTWRACLVVAVWAIVSSDAQTPPPPALPPPVVQWQAPPAPVVQWQAVPPPERPLRRIGAALTDLGDAIIGAIRR